MKAAQKKLKITELLVISLVWLVLVLAPFLFSGESRFQSWERFLRPFEVLGPLFVLFLVNRLVLTPRLFFRKKWALFFVSVFLLVGLFTLGLLFLHHPQMRPAGPPGGPFPGPLPPHVNFLITSVLLIGFDTGLQLSIRSMQIEREKEELEKENIKNQLAFLHHQISPHFFMNTLNNIHALVDISGERAKDAILQLSKMMRYLLYDTAHGQTTLAQEIEFMRSYLELMKLRVSDKVDIQLHLPDEVPEAILPPLLFVPFVENAFKHGVSYQQPSFIHIDLRVESKALHFQVENSKAISPRSDEGSGIGIENVRRRLDLIYGPDYRLEIEDRGGIFRVELFILNSF